MLTFQADSAIFRRGEMSVLVLFRENHRYGSKPWGTYYNNEKRRLIGEIQYLKGVKK